MNTSDHKTLFLSHASVDKNQYVEPFAEALDKAGINYWLDSSEIRWGDSFVAAINRGLSNSDFLIPFLSNAFLDRPWPEAEFYSALAIQNSGGQARVLPLICDSKEDVLHRYPLLKSLAYKEFSEGTEALVLSIKELIKSGITTSEDIEVIVCSGHTGEQFPIKLSLRATIDYFSKQAGNAMSANTELDTGYVTKYWIRYVMVETSAREFFESLSRAKQSQLYGLVSVDGTLHQSFRETDRLADLCIRSGMEFYMYPVEDERIPRSRRFMMAA